MTFSTTSTTGATDPRITVVVAVLNAAATIARCIDSILNQSYRNVELIIIDGASTDGTRSLLEAYGERIDYLESGPDHGIFDAWNKALPHVSGDWVLFLGGDDCLDGTEALEGAAKILRELETETRVAYGRVRQINAVTGEEECIIGEQWEEASKRLWDYSPIPHQGTFHRSSLFAIHGSFDDSFAIVGDYEMLLRELKDHAAAFIPTPVISTMQAGGISTNPLNAVGIITELRRAQEIHGCRKSMYFWAAAYLRALGRRCLVNAMGRKYGHALIRSWRRFRGTKRY